MIKKILLIVILFLSNISAQNHFIPAWSSTPYLAMNIYVTSLTLDGVDLGAGDEIGIFDGSICVGAGVLTETIPTGGYLALIASTDDPTTTEIDGFTVGNAMTFVAWDTSAMEESDICGSTFSVGDGTFSSLGTAMVDLACPPQNDSPVADAGTDQTVDENSTVTLDGSGSYDPEGDPITYLWTAPAGITLSSTITVNPTFTAPEVQSNTDYTFTLVVNDGSLDSNPDDVVITVEDVPPVPVHFTPAWTSTPYLAMNIYVTSLTLDGVDLGAGDEIGIFDGSICVGAGVLTETIPTGGYLALIASTDDPTTTEIDGFTVGNAMTFVAWDTSAMEESDICGSTFSVGDGTFSSLGTAMVDLACPPQDSPPVADAGTDQTVDENSTVTLDGSGSYDPEGDPITYLWTAPAGITLSSTITVNPTFTAPEVQSNTDYTFTLIVNDGTSDSAPDDVIIAVEDEPKPIANAGADQVVVQSTFVQLNGTDSYDPEGDPITYLWSAPAGITISSVTDSMPTFIAPVVQSNTGFTFTLVVNDGTSDSDIDSVIITVTPSVSIDEFDQPSEFVLYYNYPNPFNPTTILHYNLPVRALVTISIYNLQGQLVKYLLNHIEEPGYKSIVWDATDNFGNLVSAGVYLYRIDAGDFTQTREMVFLK